MKNLMNPDSEEYKKEFARLEAIPFINKGDFDYRYVDESYNDIIEPVFQAVISRSKEENQRIFCTAVGTMYSAPCSKVGRKWVSIKGNLNGMIAIPISSFKNSFEHEFFPVFAAVAIKEICNEYAPGQYCSKFFNDVVCRKHNRKTCGMLFKHLEKYAVLLFGLDIVDCPKDEEMRENGLKACCMKRHTNNLPTFEDFLSKTLRKIQELMKTYDDAYKLRDFINYHWNEFIKKSFTVEVNNPNADPSKDGALWSSTKSPNGMFKGSLNGILYNVGKDLYDPFVPFEETDETIMKIESLIEEQRKLEEELKKQGLLKEENE